MPPQPGSGGFLIRSLVHSPRQAGKPHRDLRGTPRLLALMIMLVASNTWIM